MTKIEVVKLVTTGREHRWNSGKPTEYKNNCKSRLKNENIKKIYKN